MGLMSEAHSLSAKGSFERVMIVEELGPSPAQVAAAYPKTKASLTTRVPPGNRLSKTV